MYFSAVGQLRNHLWTKGRIALLGDAASCNATFGGAGTSLALIGAYILAGELSGASDIRAALARYQLLMRPFVDAAPYVRPAMLRLANPRTRTGIRALHAGARFVASPVGKAITGLSGDRLNVADDLSVPDYAHEAGIAT